MPIGRVGVHSTKDNRSTDNQIVAQTISEQHIIVDKKKQGQRRHRKRVMEDIERECRSNILIINS